MTVTESATTAVTRSLPTAIEHYSNRNPRSRALFTRACQSMPGGNTRTSVFMEPFPPYIERGKGACIFDADGHCLIDFVNNSTALILGHAHPSVVTALQEQLNRGTAFSRPTKLEIELAEVLCDRVASLETVRFCSSGTETVIQALRAAMAYTGRSKIGKFEGAFHGVGEHALISWATPANVGPDKRPRSATAVGGLAPGITDDVVVLPFNDIDTCRMILSENDEDVAAIIVDPLSTGAGFTPPTAGFLTALRQLADDIGALLIFDEIISFRVAPGGAQALYGVRPDLTTMGKVITGGTAAGAFGGRADIMSLFDPTQGQPHISHPGTYNGNPLSMAAGLATFTHLTTDFYKRLGELTAQLGSELRAVFFDFGVNAQVVTVGSLFRIHFTAEPPLDYRQALQSNATMTRWLFLSLLERGIHWSDQGNVSGAMDEEHIEAFTTAVRDSLSSL